MIELTLEDGRKISTDVVSFCVTHTGTGWVSVVNNEDGFEVSESYEEIKALLRQQRVNELAEKLFVAAMANHLHSFSMTNEDHPESQSIFTFTIDNEHFFNMAELFITEQEQRNGN